ncbi:DUF6883 domain-containing protein [Gloeobacter morelensis]|uniref:DUF6883 domain-containing protein n=1 Tax=Gloeobacter morelensis MG652769 TaxID=2781736 RepID=A0ABY3PT93_9CYAN|nr:hypothetical protein ISF26_10960 [Gloeobacter morelensis MG652769]
MKIPQSALIPEQKLTRYLLVPRVRDDKSKYLAQAGFLLSNPEFLLSAINDLIARNDARRDRENEYGTFYEVSGEIQGPNGFRLGVVTIWLQRSLDENFQFVTLKPLKENSK